MSPTWCSWSSIPDSGDEIQIFKAGIIEIADIFVINKSDLGGSDNKISEIRNYFAMAAKRPPDLPTSVKEDQGIAELLAGALRFQGRKDGRIREKRAGQSRKTISKRSSPNASRTKCGSTPAIADLLQDSGGGQSFPAWPTASCQNVKTGGSHDKKN